MFRQETAPLLLKSISAYYRLSIRPADVPVRAPFAFGSEAFTAVLRSSLAVAGIPFSEEERNEQMGNGGCFLLFWLLLGATIPTLRRLQ
jgi:hypothetical protein